MRSLSLKILLALSILVPGIALAEEAPPAGPGAVGQILFLVGFIVIFYFLLWRPQSKRAKEHKELVTNLGKGDEVLTSGGMLGRITKVTEDYIVLQIAPTVEIKIQKAAVTAALPKGTIKEIEK